MNKKEDWSMNIRRRGFKVNQLSKLRLLHRMLCVIIPILINKNTAVSRVAVAHATILRTLFVVQPVSRLLSGH